AVSDRDFIIEMSNCLSIIMMHLSRFCEEIIMWCSFEFKYIELDDGYSTGSSIMPQKKNPDIAELIRGKTGRVYGNLISILTVMKSIPLAYNKDMQEDKDGIFDSIDTVKMSLLNFSPMLKTMTILKDNMRKKAAEGFINATDCADYLVKNGVPFRNAYEITGKLVALCIDKKTTLENLDLEEYKKFSTLFEEDIFHYVNLETCLNSRDVFSGPSEKSVLTQISNAQEKLKQII
ncbi:MAG: argininosuccinate lyase, partial [Oscillospiraceae bacterium]